MSLAIGDGVSGEGFSHKHLMARELDLVKISRYPTWVYKFLNLHTMKNPQPPTAENGENLDQYIEL